MELYNYKDEKVTGTLDVTTKKELISRQPLFAALTDEEMEVLLTLFVEIKVKAGTTIVTEGDSVDKVFLIVAGMADVRHVSVQDHQLKVDSIATLDAGASIGLNDTGFYSLSGRRTATVVALTDMILLELSVAAFHGFALSYSHVGDIMHRSINFNESG